jgi:4-hydroxy-tetrahydrodipicolinate reductase
VEVDEMINVIVAGAAGRMGRRIGYMVSHHPRLRYAAAFESPGHSGVGADAGELAGVGNNGVIVAESLASVINEGDVLIDFTHPQATMEFARQAAASGVAMVIGTTGLSDAQRDELAELSAHFPCVQAPNMSVCVNVLFKVVHKVAAVLGPDYDVEILEAHHKMKKDAPSGTALKLGELAAEAVGANLAKVGVRARDGLIGERKPGEIGIQTIRAADIVGEHTVYFAGPGERLELTHRAHTRDHFARGATVAAAWLEGKGNGLYSMFDVLELGEF